MSFPLIDPMNNAGNVLDLIAKKQKAIGENLANIDTPGYTRKDVSFAQHLGAADNSLQTQLSKKLGDSVVFDEDTGEIVNPANELMELQKNALLYSMATKRMSNIISQMRTVIKVGG